MVYFLLVIYIITTLFLPQQALLLFRMVIWKHFVLCLPMKRENKAKQQLIKLFSPVIMANLIFMHCL